MADKKYGKLVIAGALAVGFVVAGLGTGLAMDNSADATIANLTAEYDAKIALADETLATSEVLVANLETEIVADEAIIADLEAREPEVITETVTETETVEVEVETIVEVDNGNLADVLDHIYDNDGSVEYLIDHLDDDEVDQIVDRIAFINDAKKLAIDGVKDDLFDELDDVKPDDVGFKLDKDDMERLRINDNDDELEILDVDFEDLDADIMVTGTFNQENNAGNTVKFSFAAQVEINDGEYDEINSIEVTRE